MTENVNQAVEALLRAEGEVRAGALAETLGVSRQTAHRHLRTQVDAGALVREGSGRGTRYLRPAGQRGARRERTFRYPTAGLAEDQVWEDLVARAPAIGALTGDAERVYQYALTELVNNVIDHAGADEVVVRLEPAGDRLRLEVIDRGVGLFQHVRDGLGLGSELEALQEISKGKTTTMPDRHTGEGLFFVSKAADRFVAESHGLAWLVDNAREDMAAAEIDPPREGTLVRFEARPDAVRPLRGLFDAYTDDFEFSRTRTTVKLFAIGTRFVSRSEAERLMHNLDRFREVVFDFAGVDGIGQGFADEVFRVWARAHPEVRLSPVRMNDAVRFLVDRARSGGP